MTIEEILRRIVRAHLPTIIVCALVPLALVTILARATPPTYVARVRMQTSSTAPASTTEADSLSSRVFAMATTPSFVRSALADAGQPSSAGDAIKLAAHDITTQRLGESPIVELAVLGKKPRVATAIARSLAGRVVDFMNSAGGARFAGALHALDGQQADATLRRDRLQQTLAGTVGLRARTTVRSALQSAQSTVDHLADERSSLVLANANRDVVVPVDLARPAVEKVPSTFVPRAALALLLGLLVGLAAAVVQETLSPRIAGVRTLARLLDAPLLGTTGQLWASLADSMAQAARRQGVETLVLVGVDDRDELVATELRDALPGIWNPDLVDTTSSEGPAQSATQSAAQKAVPVGNQAKRTEDRPTVQLSSRLRFTGRHGVSAAEEPAAGVVVVSSGNARRSQLDGVLDMVRAMRWPVVGVVEVTSRRTEDGA